MKKTIFALFLLSLGLSVGFAAGHCPHLRKCFHDHCLAVKKKPKTCGCNPCDCDPCTCGKKPVIIGGQLGLGAGGPAPHPFQCKCGNGCTCDQGKCTCGDSCKCVNCPGKK